MPFIVAGNPTESIEQLKAAGVDDFIHIRLNVLKPCKNIIIYCLSS